MPKIKTIRITLKHGGKLLLVSAEKYEEQKKHVWIDEKYLYRTNFKNQKMCQEQLELEVERIQRLNKQYGKYKKIEIVELEVDGIKIVDEECSPFKHFPIINEDINCRCILQKLKE